MADSIVIKLGRYEPWVWRCGGVRVVLGWVPADRTLFPMGISGKKAKSGDLELGVWVQTPPALLPLLFLHHTFPYLCSLVAL